jgi:hypothetical protein
MEPQDTTTENPLTTVPTARELRSELAAEQFHVYEVASFVGLNPQRLGRMLAETLPMPDDVARRVIEAIAKVKSLRGVR